MVEGDKGAAPSREHRSVWFCLVRTNADPVDLIADSLRFRLGASSAHTNDRIEGHVSEPAHAIPNPKATHLVRIALVRSLVDQRSHVRLLRRRSLFWTQDRTKC